MAKTVKMCDMSRDTAAKVFMMLNPGKVKYAIMGEIFDDCPLPDLVLITDVEPKDLVYPEGWYYAKGTFRNKHTSTTGMYSTIEMMKSNGQFWENYAKYCTKDM